MNDKYKHQRTYKVKFRKSRKAWLDQVRAVPCTDCKGTYPPECMDFDHMPGHVKSFGIMSHYDRYSMAVMLAEIAKCEIVCANCHRIRTAARR